MRVKSRHEKNVSTALEGKGYTSFLPVLKSRRKWSDRYREVELPLFPGYVFCRFDVERRLPILIIPGVVQVVGFGKIPHPVDTAEVDHLQTVVNSGMLLQPCPFLKIGDRVLIEEGPLRNVEGVLLETKGSQQLVVSITLLQRSVAVCIERNWARAVK